MKPIVSVIVPVYNAEHFIKRCVDSILQQRFTEIELILVDDGSKDQSGQICDEYAMQDLRVKVIHQRNKGAGAARNAGIRTAKGEYLAFCDSDDTVSEMWLERLVLLADAETLPVGGYCLAKDCLGKKIDLKLQAEKKMSSNVYYEFNKVGIAGFLWNALYRKDIIVQNNLWIREHRESGDYNEDLLFTLNYVPYIKNIVYTGYADYLYDVREDSLSHSYQKYYFEKYEEKYRLWSGFIRENDTESEEMQKDLSTRYLFHFLTAIQMEAERGNFRGFKNIIQSEDVQTCLALADAQNENPFIIKQIKNKKIFTLWIFYLLRKLKRG